MPTATPRLVRRWAVRVVCVTGPLTLATLLAWWFRWLPDRPALTFMVYQLLLLATLTAVCVAAVTAGQMAIARAFTAGYWAGMRAATPPDGDDVPKHLRVVE